MTDSPVNTLHGDVVAFAAQLISFGFRDDDRNDAAQGVIDALAKDDWISAHRLLGAFTTDCGGEVSDRARTYKGLIKKRMLSSR